MEIQYVNTRDSSERVGASRAILNGLAGGGGLYVPQAIPKLDVTAGDLARMTYREVAHTVMRLFLTDFTEGELKDCISRAYDSGFDTPYIAPLARAGGAWYLELFHGATCAFKDMALSVLPRLLVAAAKKNNVKNEIVILTATSGDTGKAALAGFADVPGTKIIVFYPKDGVSPIQERQMITQRGGNTFVVGIRGNFDRAQSGVKRMFSDPALGEDLAAAGYQLSSANSINIGRLVPQIVYYVYAYARMFARGEVNGGEPVNVVVPTGNFGNILAAFYAKQMDLPIGRLICASNENRVLYDFFRTGVYDKNRAFALTSSPSMDILVSNNLERLIYRAAGEDAARNAAFMKQLEETGRYEITEKMRESLSDFYGGFADEAETAAAIRSLYRQEGYLIDPHTAVATAVSRKYIAETGDEKKMLIASTASPFKFTKSVMSALGEEQKEKTDLELIDALSELTGLQVPRAIEGLRDAKVRHRTVCEPEEMEAAVRRVLL